MTDNIEPGPGEARTRKRQINQIIYIGFAAVLGGVIGFSTGFFDQGDGSLFTGDWEQLSLDPTIALSLAAALLFAFLILPLWGFRMIDELKREHNYIAFTAGCLSALSGFPVWAMLYAGGFAPPPHAFGLFAIVFFSMIFGYVIARFRV